MMSKTSAAAAVFVVALLLFGGTQCARARVETPTREIVERVLKEAWDKKESSFNPKSTLTLDDLKMGEAYRATVQEVQVEGLPEGGMVTPAVVRFTVRTYYNSETQAVQRAREARIYKDKLGDWAVMTGSVKGEDSTTKEPAGN